MMILSAVLYLEKEKLCDDYVLQIMLSLYIINVLLGYGTGTLVTVFR